MKNETLYVLLGIAALVVAVLFLKRRGGTAISFSITGSGAPTQTAIPLTINSQAAAVQKAAGLAPADYMEVIYRLPDGSLTRYDVDTAKYPNDLQNFLNQLAAQGIKPVAVGPLGETGY